MSEVIGTARIDVVVNTDTLNASIDTAKNRLASMSADAQAQYAKLDASEKRRVDTLIKQSDQLGKTRAEQIAYNAALVTSGPLLDQIRGKLLANGAATAATSVAMDGFAVSSGHARIELARLANDLARGNFGSAERATISLANSTGILSKVFSAAGLEIAAGAVAVGVLVKAFIDGQAEQDAYNKALIETGGYAGVTSARLNDMAKSLSAVSGTQHDAADALAKVVATGKFTADQIQLVAEAAAQAGDGADKMIAEFVKLADDPAKAIADLNSQQHFLTAATFDQIQALEDQGRTQDAATLAIQTYANTAIQRTGDVKQSLGYLETGWNDVKDAAKGAWDTMLDIGRPGAADKVFGPVKQYLGDVADLWHEIRNPMQTVFQQGYNLQSDTTKQGDDARAAAIKSYEDQANAGAIALAQIPDQYKTAEQKRADEITKIHAQANDAIAKAIKANDQQLANNIRQAESAAVAAVNTQFDSTHHKNDPGVSALSTFQQYVSGLTDSSLTVQGDSALTKYVQDMAKLVDEYDKAIAKGANVGAATTAYWQAATAEAAKYKQSMDAAAAADAAYGDQLAEQTRLRGQQIDLQVASIGMGQREFQEMTELNQVYEDFNKQLAQLNKLHDDGLADADYQNRLQTLEANEKTAVDQLVDGFKRADDARMQWQNGLVSGMQNFIDQGQDVAGMVSGAFTDAFDNMNDALVQWVQTGKISGKQFADDLIADLTRIALKVAESQLLTSILGMFATGPSGYNVGYFGSFNTGAATNTADSVIDSIIGPKPHAKGGVFDSPSLAQYLNGVYDSPQFFVTKHAQGNVFAEAGEEAVMPLSRDASGRLGVKAQGGTGGGATVIVENHTDSKAQVQKSKDGNGNDIIKVIVGKAVNEVNSQIARGGSTAQIIQQRYGLSQRGTPVSG